ncbi:MAG TPA: DoxX-like family protein [Tepidisphaeraceae bacterium]|jgi:hypothetical protein|nr:DoxX-like family protein [Tepidisphaeraceae bacterium]
MSADAPGIYVEIEIDAPLERIWEMTQKPQLHHRWDLRFSDIQYLSRPDPEQPQRFRYTTRIGMGMGVCGEGETAGSFDAPSGQRSSALKFWSDDPKSLIRKGSGFWKYIPPADSTGRVRFLTRYDYDVRFGIAGRWVDRLAFRPLLGWATAWSFDRLRLWAERDIDPAVSAQRWLIHFVSRVALAFIWIYQGLVPKILFQHKDELAMLHDVGLSTGSAKVASLATGAMEIVAGLIILLVWKSRWPLWVTLSLMPAMAVCVAIASPRMIVGAFNPIALNAAVFALAAVALISARDLPSARRCLRRPDAGEKP